MLCSPLGLPAIWACTNQAMSLPLYSKQAKWWEQNFSWSHYSNKRHRKPHPCRSSKLQRHSSLFDPGLAKFSHKKAHICQTEHKTTNSQGFHNFKPQLVHPYYKSSRAKSCRAHSTRHGCSSFSSIIAKSIPVTPKTQNNAKQNLIYPPAQTQQQVLFRF